MENTGIKKRISLYYPVYGRFSWMRSFKTNISTDNRISQGREKLALLL